MSHYRPNETVVGFEKCVDSPWLSKIENNVLLDCVLQSVALCLIPDINRKCNIQQLNTLPEKKSDILNTGVLNYYIMATRERRHQDYDQSKEGRLI
jgi:hypothetical protein